MHWTLAVLIALCGLCALLNLFQFAFTRTVRGAGLLICGAWAVQQSYWWTTGGDSFALIAACDAGIIGWFVWRLYRGRTFDLGERMIAATIPLTTALVAFAWLNGGATTESWWANWWIVAGQMTAGLPFLGVAYRRARDTTREFDPWKHFDWMEKA